MQYPIRSKRNGKMYLRKGHFGIAKRKYLYAMIEFIKGSSLEETAMKVSQIVRENISKTMIKETFRANLLQTLLRFQGDENRISIIKFCEDNNISPVIFKKHYARLNQQKTTLVIIYLREVFDIKSPLEIKK